MRPTMLGFAWTIDSRVWTLPEDRGVRLAQEIKGLRRRSTSKQAEKAAIPLSIVHQTVLKIKYQ